MSDSVQHHRWQPTRLLCPWDSPGKNTGVGCHFLLQCMEVKSESEVAPLCSTLSNPMGCSLPGSSVHGIFQARVLEWGAIAFSCLSLGEHNSNHTFFLTVAIIQDVLISHHSILHGAKPRKIHEGSLALSSLTHDPLLIPHPIQTSSALFLPPAPFPRNPISANDPIDACMFK